MKKSIVYLPELKRHVDLSTIISISDAHFIDRRGTGTGGWFVGFNVQHMLQDTESHFTDSLDHYGRYKDTVRFNPNSGGYRRHELLVVNPDGTAHWTEHVYEGQEILAVKQYQERVVDPLIKLWKDYKGE